MRAPDRLARTVLVVSLVLATSTPIAWELMTPPANAGTLPTVEITAPSPPSTADAVSPAGSAPEVDAADTARLADTADTVEAARQGEAARRNGTEPAAGTAERGSQVAAERVRRPSTRSARIADLDAAPTAVPERLRIPSIDVEAPIVAIGVEDNGEMEVPDDVDDVGWYRHGPAPGEPGSTVVAGHVDSREQGPGAFFDLRGLDVGARVEVTDSSGEVQRYDVVARRTYEKAVLPADELFSREGPSQLVLITCGGDFDRQAGSYRENVVIYAQPSSAS